MTKKEITRYIVRFVGTIASIVLFLFFVGFSATSMGSAIGSVVEIFPFSHAFFWFLVLSWICFLQEFSVAFELFVRSLVTGIEAHYPSKKFRRQVKSMIWSFMINLILTLCQIVMLLQKNIDNFKHVILGYLMGIAAGLTILLHSLQFLKPRARKTWALNLNSILMLLIFIAMMIMALSHSSSAQGLIK